MGSYWNNIKTKADSIESAKAAAAAALAQGDNKTVTSELNRISGYATNIVSLGTTAKRNYDILKDKLKKCEEGSKKAKASKGR